MTTSDRTTADCDLWIAESLGRPVSAVDRLPGDLSPRRYARVQWGDAREPTTAILATYPQDRLPELERFGNATALLAGTGVRVPAIYATEPERGWMLLEDFGERTLAERQDLSPHEVLTCFVDAVEQGRRIANLAPARVTALGSETLGATLLQRELEQSKQLFLEPRGFLADPGLARDLDRALASLCTTLGQEPAVPCHRDYMARNLVPLATARGQVGVIDHQDLRLGPPHYDLASLLNDTLFLEPQREAAILETSLSTAAERESFLRAAAQRTLKAVGTYEKFVRAGGERHLGLIAPTFERFLVHFARIPEGEGLAARLARIWGK